MSSFVAWAFETRQRHPDAHALFPAAPKPRPEAGKLPWRMMVGYSGKLGKKVERVIGEEQPVMLIVGQPQESKQRPLRVIVFPQGKLHIELEEHSSKGLR